MLLLILRRKVSLRNDHVVMRAKLYCKVVTVFFRSSVLPFIRQVNSTGDVSDLLVTCPDPAPLAPSSLVNSPIDLHTLARTQNKTHTHTPHTQKWGQDFLLSGPKHQVVGLTRLRPAYCAGCGRPVGHSCTLQPPYDVSNLTLNVMVEPFMV